MIAKLTILTATWNRRDLLTRLYASLLAQTGYHEAFEWVVVDDGSTDDTVTYLTEIAQKAPFVVHVLSKENGGKHRALNRGVQAVATEWTLVVDSDDWLLDNGIAKALQNLKSSDALDNVTGIVAMREFGDDDPSDFHNECEGTINYAAWSAMAMGDTSILIRTALMRETPFPDFPSENFVAESSVYARAFRSGGILLSNDKIVGAEYQPGGLTDRSLALRVNNPLGCLYCYNTQLNAGLTDRARLRTKANYHRFFWHGLLDGKMPKNYGFRSNPLWLALTAPLALRDRLRTKRSQE